jgi:hypothetical protein
MWSGLVADLPAAGPRHCARPFGPCSVAPGRRGAVARQRASVQTADIVEDQERHGQHAVTWPCQWPAGVSVFSALRSGAYSTTGCVVDVQPLTGRLWTVICGSRAAA